MRTRPIEREQKINDLVNTAYGLTPQRGPTHVGNRAAADANPSTDLR